MPAILLHYRQRSDRRVMQRAAVSFAARVGGVVESAMDAIITVDEQQRVVQFNAAAESVFRWPRNAVIGQKLDMLLPERFRPAHQAHIDRFGKTAATSRSMGSRMVLAGVRADGDCWVFAEPADRYELAVTSPQPAPAARTAITLQTCPPRIGATPEKVLTNPVSGRGPGSR